MMVLTEQATLLVIGAIFILLVVVALVGRRLEGDIGKIHFELRPNGGSTVRDAIDRIEAIGAVLEARCEHIECRVLSLEHTVTYKQVVEDDSGEDQ
jgi:hypothetical protein